MGQETARCGRYYIPINVTVLDCEELGVDIGERVLQNDFPTANAVLSPMGIEVLPDRWEVLDDEASRRILSPSPYNPALWDNRATTPPTATQRQMINQDLFHLNHGTVDRGGSPQEEVDLENAVASDGGHAAPSISSASFSQGQPSSEVQELLSVNHRRGQLTCYWVPYMGQWGLSVMRPHWDTSREGLIIASAQCRDTAPARVNQYVFAHELVHMLTKAGHTDLAGRRGEDVQAPNLMTPYPAGSHLTDAQRQRILESDYLISVLGHRLGYDSLRESYQLARQQVGAGHDWRRCV